METKMDNYQENSGFTLIELLLVISIIGLLASITLVSFTEIRKLARDTVRVEQMRIIAQALDHYYIDNGSYPDSTGLGPGGTNWTDSCTDQANFIPGLVPNYMGMLPADPANCKPAVFSAEILAYGYLSNGSAFVLAIHPETNNQRFRSFFDPANDGGADPCIVDGAGVIRHFVISRNFPCP